MQDITQDLIRKKIHYDKLFKTCGYFLSYLSDPEQTTKKIIKELDIPSNKDLDDTNFLHSMKELDTLLTSVFTKEHAVSKGRQLLKENIKKYESEIKNDKEALKSKFKLLSDSLKNDLHLIFTTIELNNPLRNLKMITEGKEMIRNYFESRLVDFNKSETVAGLGDTIKNMNTIDIFALLPVVLAKGIEKFSTDFQQKVDMFNKSSELLHQLYIGRHSNPSGVYEKEFPMTMFMVPRLPFIKWIASETKEYKTYQTVSEAFYQMILYMVTTKEALRDKVGMIISYLDKISTTDFKYWNEILDHMLQEGIYKYDKPIITLEEVNSIYNYDSKYLEVFHSNNSRFVNNIMKSAIYAKAILDLYVELSNYVYKALNKVV
jgi:hypothetical protein